MDLGMDKRGADGPVMSEGDDSVVAEVRAAREALFADAGFDLEALGRFLRERQVAAGRVGVVLTPRAPDASSQAA